MAATCNADLVLEIVPLCKFTRAGRRGHYLSCGVVLLEKQDADVAPEDLYFTHRTAHGGDADREAAHGDLTNLADVELRRLKQKY